MSHVTNKIVRGIDEVKCAAKSRLMSLLCLETGSFLDADNDDDDDGVV
jgi:hypothetical protein